MRFIFGPVLSIWHAYTRRLDVKMIWPICVEKTNSLDEAKAVFAVHAFNDPGWQELGTRGILDAIDRLTQESKR